VLFSGPEALKMYLTVNPIDNLEHAVRTISAYHPSITGPVRTLTRKNEGCGRRT
jgi:hypothetical protein